MSEHLPQQPEHLTGPETAELQRLAEQARERVEASPTAEKADTGAERAEVARDQIENQAEQPPAFEEKAPDQPDPAPTRLDRQVAYRQTMKSLQRRLDPASRSFSRFIHHPAVDKTSELVGKTVLRPSVTLGATVTALLFVGVVYLVANHYGFAMRGSELPLALVAGGLIGAGIELVSKVFRRK